MLESGPAPTRRSRPNAQSAQAAPAISSSAKSGTERASSTAVAVAPVNQMGLFKPDVDLVIKVNSLEQQLARSREESQQLRRQLTDSDRRLQAEQQKNRALKGE